MLTSPRCAGAANALLMAGRHRLRRCRRVGLRQITDLRGPAESYSDVILRLGEIEARGL
jgi:hypothetical protein